MSGKFKIDVARSQTLSYISSFAGAESNNVEDEQKNKNKLAQSDNYHIGSKPHDFLLNIPNSKRVDSLRLSPFQAKALSNKLKNLDIVINASSEYDLDKDSIVQSRESLEQDAAINQNAKQNYKESAFKQNFNQNLKKHLQSSLFSANQLENSSNVTGIPANLAVSQDQGENRFSQIMSMLKVPENQNGLDGSQYGSIYSSKQLKASNAFKEKDCSIIYNSCQINISCSLSVQLLNQSKKLQQKQQSQNLQKKNSLAEEDEENSSMLFSNPKYNKDQISSPDVEKQIIKEYTQSTISKIMYLDSKTNELESLENQDVKLSKKIAKYVTNRLRLVKRAPFSSIQLSDQLCTSSTISQSNFAKSNGISMNHRFMSNQDYQTFHSNQPSIVKRNPHYISKIHLDIDCLIQRDICLTSEEFYTFVLPLDAHFPNVIMTGTLTGKILLFQLCKDQQRKKYVQKLSKQIFPKSSEERQVYPTCAAQFKSNFYIGGSDGSVYLFDFKKKEVVSILENQCSVIPDNCNLECSVAFGLSLGLEQNEENEEKNKTAFSVKNLKATSKKLIFGRNDGMVIVVDSQNLNEIIFQKRFEGLVKCDFSCGNEDNIIVLTDEKLEVIHTTKEKVIFKMKSSVQEQMNFADFQVNSVTKEIIVLQNNQMIQTSKIQILRNSSSRIRTVETIKIENLIISIALDKQMENMFCISQTEICIWNIFNQKEFQQIQQSILEKVQDPEDILTTNDSCY
ncbi:hypothetical protein TTHERM_00891190 (macronuclear) [Tetrahymena thermophila SB210]|uniref:Uncharacterized protein n=1 Tax=Tetrahymena thermophila (strain SB210) TaxID=312017 RepID=Q23U78_TETTS|nr:hypothetical protein TTHERM_00891190 [Tetrahymena thermophila SB210]EAS00066.1 hypothetical protein TTHERM_00891190 [Tetrahymena thermophila SB210]|eukprot:XP_001020311.1 hypothetical protein TTHERM_00891190 [Tetrahymena thermophila SB210]